MAKKKSKWIEEAGLKARLFKWGERRELYYDWRDPLENGKRSRRSTTRSSWKEAEAWVRVSLREFAKAGERRNINNEKTTLGTILSLYFTERVPQLSPAWQKSSKTRRALFEAAWGREMPIEDIDKGKVDTFEHMRRTGSLRPKNSNVTAVRVGTAEADLRWLSTVLNWVRTATSMPHVKLNPLEGIKWSKEKKLGIRRPETSHARYIATMARVDEVDADGRLRCMLILARFTGHRLSAIRQLRASDFLRTQRDVERAIADLGQDVKWAAHYTGGGLRWRAEFDKGGVSTITPLPPEAREGIIHYLEASPRVGEAWLFPSPTKSYAPVRKELAIDWLRRAERLADLPKLSGVSGTRTVVCGPMSVSTYQSSMWPQQVGGTTHRP